MIGLLFGSLDDKRTVPLARCPQRRVISVNTPSPSDGAAHIKNRADNRKEVLEVVTLESCLWTYLVVQVAAAQRTVPCSSIRYEVDAVTGQMDHRIAGALLLLPRQDRESTDRFVLAQSSRKQIVPWARSSYLAIP